MSCKIRNAKGLNAKCESLLLCEVSELEKFVGRLRSEAGPAGAALAEALSALPNRVEYDATWRLQSGQAFGPNVDKKKTMAALLCLPGSWVNESHPIDCSPAAAAAEIAALGALAETFTAGMAAALAAGIESPFGRWTDAKLAELPKASAAPMKALAKGEISEAGAEANAAPGQAWAIWLSDGQGFMDRNKDASANPAGARLFESAAAAERTAKASGVGNPAKRGAGAIVELEIEPRSVERRSEDAEDGFAGIDGALARLEEASIMEACSGPADWWDEPEASADDSFFDGYAVWIEPRKGSGVKFEGGFENQRWASGPLGGASLSSTLEDAKRQMESNSWSRAGAVVKVAARPVKVGVLLGEPKVKALEAMVEKAEQSKRSLAVAAAKAAGKAPEAPKARRSNSL